MKCGMRGVSLWFCMNQKKLINFPQILTPQLHKGVQITNKKLLYRCVGTKAKTFLTIFLEPHLHYLI